MSESSRSRSSELVTKPWTTAEGIAGPGFQGWSNAAPLTIYTGASTRRGRFL